MKTLFETSKTAKITTLNFWLLGCCLALIALQSCVSTVYVPEQRTTVVRREVVPPPWAPSYDNVEQVHYYYLPDVEVYYDVWNHEYVYLHEGNWVFTSVFPSYYSTYDINSAFVVVLDYRVNEPWRQHQQYVSHYPRYYYRSVYDDDGRRRDNGRNGNTYNNTTVINNTTINNYGGVRGFNENAKTPIYRNTQQTNTTPSRRYSQPNQRGTSTSPANNQQTQPRERTDTRRSFTSDPNTAPNSNTQNTSGRDVSRGNDNNSQDRGQRTDSNKPSNITERRNDVQQNTDNKPIRSDNTEQKKSVEPTRTQPAVYRGREVGQPVRVKRDMQPTKETRNSKDMKKETQKDDSKSNSDATSGRRR